MGAWRTNLAKGYDQNWKRILADVPRGVEGRGLHEPVFWDLHFAAMSPEASFGDFCFETEGKGQTQTPGVCAGVLGFGRPGKSLKLDAARQV